MRAHHLMSASGLALTFLVPLGLALSSWQWIELELTNPGEIVGRLARAGYHPANDVLRFLWIVGAPAAALLMLYAIPAARERLTRAHRPDLPYLPPATGAAWRSWLAAAAMVWAGVIAVHYHTQAYAPFERPLDTYHEGIALGAATDQAHGKAPYRDTALARGWFLDPGIAEAAFAVFGRSIHSVRLLEALLATLAFLLAAVVVVRLSSPEPAFIPAALGYFFILAILRPLGAGFLVIGRDVTLYLFLLAVIAAGRRFARRQDAPLALFLMASIATAAWAMSVDRGLFLTLPSLVAAGAGCFVRPPKNVLVPMIGGWILGIVVFGGAIQWQFSSFVTFFVSYASYVDLLNGLPYPFDRLYAIVPMVLLAFLAFWFLWRFLQAVRLHELRASVGAFCQQEFITLVMLATALFMFRPGLGRSDGSHIQYSSTTIYLLLLHLVIEHGIRRRPRRWRSESSVAAGMGAALLLVCTVWYHSHYSLGKWSFPSPSDDELVPESYRLTVDYLNQVLAPDESFYTVNNESIWPYLLDRPCPTRWHLLGLAASKDYQREVVEDLAASKTKILLRRNDSHRTRISGHLFEERQPIVNAYVEQNYRFLRRIQDQELWIRRE